MCANGVHSYASKCVPDGVHSDAGATAALTGQFTDVVVSMVVLMSVLRCTSPDGSTKRWPARRGGQHGRADADASAARRRTDHRREGQHGHADVGTLPPATGRITVVMASMVMLMPACCGTSLD